MRDWNQLHLFISIIIIITIRDLQPRDLADMSWHGCDGHTPSLIPCFFNIWSANSGIHTGSATKTALSGVGLRSWEEDLHAVEFGRIHHGCLVMRLPLPLTTHCVYLGIPPTFPVQVSFAQSIHNCVNDCMSLWSFDYHVTRYSRIGESVHHRRTAALSLCLELHEIVRGITCVLT